MSLRVVGYLNGRRIVVDEGESRARCAGYGGSAMSHAITITRAPTIRSNRDIARQKQRAEKQRLWREAHPEHRGRTL